MMYLVVYLVVCPQTHILLLIFKSLYSKVVPPTYRCTQLVGDHTIVGHTILVSENHNNLDLSYSKTRTPNLNAYS